MNIFIWLVGVGISLYTVGYGITLYKLGNKSGGVATCFLSLIVGLTPVVIIRLFR